MIKRGSTLLFPIILLALLAALTYWMNIKVQPAPPRPDAALRHDPDYYLNKFESTNTDINGLLSYRLRAQKMKHYPDDDSTDLEYPVFTQYDQGKQYIQVTGKRGEVSGNGEDVKIYENVVVRREPWGDKGLMTLETEYLHVIPNEDIVLTQKPVLIKQAPETVVHANGMVYEKAKQKLTLLNRVRAHYVSPKKSTSKPVKTLSLKNNSPSTTQEIKKLRQKSQEAKHLPNEE